MIKFFDIYSNWVFVWFLLFILKIIKYNPFLLLVTAYIITVCEITYLLYNKISYNNLKKFIIINVILKLIPIIILILIKKNNYNTNDIIFTIILTTIYYIYLLINNKNLEIVYKKISNSYLDNNSNDKSFISKLYDKIIN